VAHEVPYSASKAAVSGNRCACSRKRFVIHITFVKHMS
jgi:hypothetical protein